MSWAPVTPENRLNTERKAALTQQHFPSSTSVQGMTQAQGQSGQLPAGIQEMTPEQVTRKTEHTLSYAPQLKPRTELQLQNISSATALKHMDNTSPVDVKSSANMDTVPLTRELFNYYRNLACKSDRLSFISYTDMWLKYVRKRIMNKQ
jgi:hypothetical protein